MSEAPTVVAVGDHRVVVYAGRRVPAGLPAGVTVLDAWDVDAPSLAAALADATSLVVLDALSFPYELLDDEHRDLPVVVVLPPELSTDAIAPVLATPLLQWLTPYDRVVTGDDAHWEVARQTAGLGQRQRLAMAGDDLAGLIAALDGAPTARAKARHRVLADCIRRQLADVRAARPLGAPVDVLHHTVGDGTFAGLMPRRGGRYVGVDADEIALARAREQHPDHRFEHVRDGAPLPFADGSFDLTLAVGTLGARPAPARRELVAELWRVCRSGGQIVVIDQVVHSAGLHRPGIGELVAAVAEGSRYRVVLEHVESLRDRSDDLHRLACLRVSKLGAAGRW